MKRYRTTGLVRSAEPERTSSRKHNPVQGKIGCAFGAWGWSGEAVEMMSETMKQILEMDVFEPPIKLAGKTDEFGLGQHRDLGRKIAQKIKGKNK